MDTTEKDHPDDIPVFEYEDYIAQQPFTSNSYSQGRHNQNNQQQSSSNKGPGHQNHKEHAHHYRGGYTDSGGHRKPSSHRNPYQSLYEPDCQYETSSPSSSGQRLFSSEEKKIENHKQRLFKHDDANHKSYDNRNRRDSKHTQPLVTPQITIAKRENSNAVIPTKELLTSSSLPNTQPQSITSQSCSLLKLLNKKQQEGQSHTQDHIQTLEQKRDKNRNKPQKTRQNESNNSIWNGNFDNNSPRWDRSNNMTLDSRNPQQSSDTASYVSQGVQPMTSARTPPSDDSYFQSNYKSHIKDHEHVTPSSRGRRAKYSSFNDHNPPPHDVFYKRSNISPVSIASSSHSATDRGPSQHGKGKRGPVIGDQPMLYDHTTNSYVSAESRNFNDAYENETQFRRVKWPTPKNSDKINTPNEKGNPNSQNDYNISGNGITKFALFDEYLAPQKVQEGLKNGELLQGPIRINKKNRFDAYVSIEGREHDIFIFGQRHRNRSFDADVVVVKLLEGHELLKTKNKFQDFKDNRRLDGDARQKKITMAVDAHFSGKDLSDHEMEDSDDEELIGNSGNSDAVLLAADDDENEDSERQFGKVVYIAERHPNRTFCGVLSMEKWSSQGEAPAHSYVDVHPDFKFIWFKPTDKRVPFMTVSRSDAPNEFLQNPDAFANVLFRVSVSKWSVQLHNPFGILHGPVGQIGAIGPETDALLIENGITWDTFDDDILTCLPPTPWSIPESEIAKRRDFRKERVFTIDPLTARDLDDAISCKPLDDDTYEIGVHIADVSYFVKTGTALDREARNRSTSIYLVQKAIPMLPRLLCEELCSLNPNVDRLTFSIIWKMDKNANVIGEPWFGRSIIRSCAKLSYDHAQAVIEGKNNWDGLPVVELGEGYGFNDVKKDILTMFGLSQKMRARRFEKGALSMNSVKLSFGLDHNGNPIECHVYNIRESNRLIEEFMLLANMAVATKLWEKFPDSALLRCHQPPSARQMRNFTETAAKLGFHIDPSSSSSLQASFDAIMDVDAREVLQLLAIKPMKRATYYCTGSSEVTSFHHYALNVPLYTHFTSPIRRYCDLLVHRLLDCALRNAKNPCGAVAVDGFAKRCNLMKFASKYAQDASQKLYLVAYLEHLATARSSGNRELVREKGVVFRVGTRSYDVLVKKYGIEQRVWVEDCMDKGEALGCDFDSEKNELYIFWSKRGVGEGNDVVTAASSKIEVDDKPMVVAKDNDIVVANDEITMDDSDEWATDDDSTSETKGERTRNEEAHGVADVKRRSAGTDDEELASEGGIEDLVQNIGTMSVNSHMNSLAPVTPSSSSIPTPSKAEKSPFRKRMTRRNIDLNQVHVQIVKIFDWVSVGLLPVIGKSPPEIKVFGVSPLDVPATSGFDCNKEGLISTNLVESCAGFTLDYE